VNGVELALLLFPELGEPEEPHAARARLARAAIPIAIGERCLILILL
jgi:hypothetical protein